MRTNQQHDRKVHGCRGIQLQKCERRSSFRHRTPMDQSVHKLSVDRICCLFHAACELSKYECDSPMFLQTAFLSFFSLVNYYCVCMKFYQRLLRVWRMAPQRFGVDGFQFLTLGPLRSWDFNVPLLSIFCTNKVAAWHKTVLSQAVKRMKFCIMVLILRIFRANSALK